MNPAGGLRGVMAAIASPCDEQEVFLPDTFSKLAHDILRAGQHGLYVCGATGDGFGMTLDDRRCATELAVAAAREYDARVIVHVGAVSTRDAAHLAQHAAEAGADAVSSMPPPMKSSQEQLVSYYGEIARASGLPTLIYYVPQVTNRVHTLGEMLELLDLEGVVGMKFSDTNYILMRRMIIERPEAVVFTGWDELLCPGLQYGAHGGIGMNYNLYPRLFRVIYDAVQQGDLARAMDLQKRLLAHMHVVFSYGLLASFDVLMRQRGYGPRTRRRPCEVLDAETEQRFLAQMEPHVAELMAV